MQLGWLRRAVAGQSPLMGAVINITGSFAWAFIAYTVCEVIVLLVLLVLARDSSPSSVTATASAR